jgi:outer membrane protein TolC
MVRRTFVGFLFFGLVLAGAPVFAADPAGGAMEHSAHPAPTVSLEEILRDGSEGNPILAARRAMATAAEQRVAPAGAWESPMGEIGVVNVPTSGRFDEDMMTMKMVGLSQRVPVFGANGLRRRAAREAAAAEGAAVLRSHYDVYGAALEAYADAYFSQRRAEEAEHHRGTMNRMAEAATARYRSGNGCLDEILRAEAERARVMADRVAFEAAAARASARLDALRGNDPGATADRYAAPPVFGVPLDADAWVAATRKDHPRLLEAEARERGYELTARAARRTAWPDLELRASYGIREANPQGIDRDNMFSAGVGFVIPIFAGQRERAMGAEFDAMARGAAAERRETELDLARDAYAVHADARAAVRTVALLADTVVTSLRRAMDAAWSGYAAGAIDLSRVFESAHALYVEDLRLLDAQHDLARAQARLVALTGRGDLAGVALPAMRKEER